MKANQTSILMYGHDEVLLATRQWVLQSRGYRVITVTDVAGFADLPLNPPIRLLLLCHTLSEHEATASIAAALARWPGIESLELESGTVRSPTGLLGQLLHTIDGPVRLVKVVDKMLGGQGQGSLPARP